MVRWIDANTSPEIPFLLGISLIFVFFSLYAHMFHRQRHRICCDWRKVCQPVRSNSFSLTTVLKTRKQRTLNLRVNMDIRVSRDL